MVYGVRDGGVSRQRCVHRPDESVSLAGHQRIGYVVLTISARGSTQGIRDERRNSLTVNLATQPLFRSWQSVAPRGSDERLSGPSSGGNSIASLVSSRTPILNAAPANKSVRPTSPRAGGLGTLAASAACGPVTWRSSVGPGVAHPHGMIRPPCESRLRTGAEAQTVGSHATNWARNNDDDPRSRDRFALGLGRLAIAVGQSAGSESKSLRPHGL